MSTVITWSDSAGNTLDITPEQGERLTAAGRWPRAEYGEYCQVSHGLHAGRPTMTDAEVDAYIAGGDLPEPPLD